MAAKAMAEVLALGRAERMPSSTQLGVGDVGGLSGCVVAGAQVLSTAFFFLVLGGAAYLFLKLSKGGGGGGGGGGGSGGGGGDLLSEASRIMDKYK